MIVHCNNNVLNCHIIHLQDDLIYITELVSDYFSHTEISTIRMITIIRSYLTAEKV